MNKGYRKIRPLEGGLDAWIDAGGEINVYRHE
jgi:3-mercaptopyruvate sulfurtransferase SseA